MSRPTQTPPRGEVVDLTDADAPDWLEAHPLCLLAFLGAGRDDASLRMRARLAIVGAKTGVDIGVLDVDRHALVAAGLGVTTAPMVLVFAKGEVVDRLMGTPPEAILEEVLRTRLKGPGTHE